MSWVWFQRVGSPRLAYALARRLRPWLLWPGTLLALWAVYDALYGLPAAFGKTDAYRMTLIYVPASLLSVALYWVMAAAAACGLLLWRTKLAHAVAAACAPCGLVFALLALVTNPLWDRPAWGLWWSWGPRLATGLLLLALYLGYIVLHQVIDGMERADRIAGLTVLLGIIDIPSFGYSVVPWVDPRILPTLWLVLAAFVVLCAAVLCDGLSAQILRRERNAKWLLDKAVMILEES